jgi:hypothetical protein
MPKIPDKLKDHAWIVILVVSLALGCFGVFRGEAIEVFEKARIVCLECIGIG